MAVTTWALATADANVDSVVGSTLASPSECTPNGHCFPGYQAHRLCCSGCYHMYDPRKGQSPCYMKCLSEDNTEGLSINCPPSMFPAPPPPPPPPAAAGTPIQSSTGMCMDLGGGDTSNGALLQMWDCYDGETQQWSFQDGQLVYMPDPTKCVDLLGGDTTNGNPLGIWDCYGGDSQQWGFDSNMGTIYLARKIERCDQVHPDRRLPSGQD